VNDPQLEPRAERHGLEPHRHAVGGLRPQAQAAADPDWREGVRRWHFAGLQMKGGTIGLMGGGEICTGAWMVCGTIIALRPAQLLPTSSFACDYNPVFVRQYAKHLRPFGFSVPCEEQEGAYRRYSGDGSVPGKGEILVWAPHAG
jgi:hypothetical protein